jgi:hypothetical protein
MLKDLMRTISSSMSIVWWLNIFMVFSLFSISSIVFQAELSWQPTALLNMVRQLISVCN